MNRRGNTSERGYGSDHQRAARELRARHRDGDICRRCGRPMFSWQKLDAGHADGAAASSGWPPDALEHRSCNRRAGQAVGSRTRWGGSGARRTSVRSRDW